MPLPPTFNREELLRKRLNTFISQSLLLPESDYYSTLTAKSILELKSVLADVNNILTLKVTMGFVDWLVKRLSLNKEAEAELQSIVLGAKPNSNGFDVWLGYPVAIVGEVKCNVPINRGSVYGSAQRNGIEKDMKALLNGKLKGRIKTDSCLKFLAFLDTPEIRSATHHLAQSSATCKEKLVFPAEGESLHRTDVVYVAYVSPGA